MDQKQDYHLEWPYRSAIFANHLKRIYQVFLRQLHPFGTYEVDLWPFDCARWCNNQLKGTSIHTTWYGVVNCHMWFIHSFWVTCACACNVYWAFFPPPLTWIRGYSWNRWRWGVCPYWAGLTARSDVLSNYSCCCIILQWVSHSPSPNIHSCLYYIHSVKVAHSMSVYIHVKLKIFSWLCISSDRLLVFSQVFWSLCNCFQSPVRSRKLLMLSTVAWRT